MRSKHSTASVDPNGADDICAGQILIQLRIICLAMARLLAAAPGAWFCELPGRALVGLSQAVPNQHLCEVVVYKGVPGLILLWDFVCMCWCIAVFPKCQNPIRLTA